MLYFTHLSAFLTHQNHLLHWLIQLFEFKQISHIPALLITRQSPLTSTI